MKTELKKGRKLGAKETVRDGDIAEGSNGGLGMVGGHTGRLVEDMIGKLLPEAPPQKCVACYENASGARDDGARDELAWAWGNMFPVAENEEIKKHRDAADAILGRSKNEPKTDEQPSVSDAAA